MKIQILSNPRSGSSYLFDSIKQSVDVCYDCYNEPFQKLDTYFTDDDLKKKDIWREQYRIVLNKIKNTENIIIKNHMFHLNALRALGLIEEFKEIKFDRTIILIRKDIFQVALSLALAMTTNQWNVDRLNFESKKIDLSVFESAINSTWKELLRIIRNEYNLEYNEIVYYDDMTFEDESEYVKFRDKSLTVDNYNELYEYTIQFLNEKVPKLRDPKNISFNETTVNINHIETT